MYYELKKGVLNKILSKAISKAGSIRKLAKLLKIPKTTVGYYQQEKIFPTCVNLRKICKYIDFILDEKQIENKLSSNWRQSLGGEGCVKSKLLHGVLNDQLKFARQKLALSGNDFSAWHKRMKKDNPTEYYLIQYNRFKKIADYKYTTKKGEKVRNLLERDVANFFFDNNIEYLYEPLINIGNKYFFPDFLIKENIVIECTMWRGYDKAPKLVEKINSLKKNYKVYVFIPEKLKKYYTSIEKNLLFDYKELERVMFK
jgi:hypothetical protein